MAGKKGIIIRDRDGIPGPAIEECAKSAGAEVVFSSTECFVLTAAGAMDLENQRRVKEIAEEYGPENVVVLLGAAEGEASGLAAETVTNGAPTYAGPLTGVSLGLTAFHVCEPEGKADGGPAVYDEQVALMEMVRDVEDNISEMSSILEQSCSSLSSGARHAVGRRLKPPPTD